MINPDRKLRRDQLTQFFKQDSSRSWELVDVLTFYQIPFGETLVRLALQDLMNEKIVERTVKRTFRLIQDQNK